MSEIITLRADALFMTEVEGETVILDTRSSTYMTTNTVGTAILKLLGDGATRESLYAHVQHLGGPDLETTRRDCDHFIEELSREGLLE